MVCRLTKSKKNRLRRSARNQHLGRLCRQQRYRCYWCDTKIAYLERILALGGRVIAAQRQLGRVVYRGPNGQIFKQSLATIDHVCPLSRGGSNAPENLVAACYQCNQDRNQLVELGAAWSLRKQEQESGS